MVRTSILFVGYACASETGSLMQSHSADLGSAGDVSFRLSKLADLQLTTKRMETEYKAMAKAIINKEIDPKTGRPYEAPRGEDMWSIVEGQFDMLLWQLGEEKKTNQKLIDDINQRVKDCNTAMDDAHTEPKTGVNARLTIQQNKETAHTECRGHENTKIEERKDSCGRFVQQKVCEVHQNDYNYFTAATQPEGHVSVPEALLNAIADATECKTELGHENTQSAKCDVDQAAYELAFCEYDQKLTDTCDTQDACYSAAIADRTAIVAGVTDLETNQKVVYKMVQKVRCYVVAMQNKFKTLKDADISACETMQLDASTLTITKPAAENKKLCDKTKLKWGVPGDESWAAQKYTSVHHKHHGEDYDGYGKDAISKIEAIVPCNDLLAAP